MIVTLDVLRLFISYFISGLFLRFLEMGTFRDIKCVVGKVYQEEFQLFYGHLS